MRPKSLMRPILNQATPPSFGRFHRHTLIGGIAAATLSLAVATAFGTVQDNPAYPGSIDEVVERIAAVDSDRVAPGHDSLAREIRIRRGDTVDALLAGMEVRDQEFAAFLRDDKEAAVIFRQLAPGKTITAKVSPAGSLQSLAFPLNGDKDTVLMIERAAEGFSADIRKLESETTLSLQSATIQHSLFAAADDAGIPDDVAVQLADIFSGEIDFHRDLRKGDRFSVIYETQSQGGKPLRSQRILAAEFVNAGKVHRAYWYRGQDGAGGYYDEKGQSAKKAFLRSPLEFSRISSGFSNARYHPVLRETRAHRGIDYAAPTGTRVKATGNGIVEHAGIQGGYGKVVIIRHPSDKTTVYGHLSGFAPGIRKGSRVSQGEVIGYVGATGIATGPHLHYEFRVAGVHRNPLTVALPDAAPLAPTEQPRFKLHAGELAARIGAIEDMQMVMLD